MSGPVSETDNYVMKSHRPVTHVRPMYPKNYLFVDELSDKLAAAGWIADAPDGGSCRVATVKKYGTNVRVICG